MSDRLAASPARRFRRLQPLAIIAGGILLTVAAGCETAPRTYGSAGGRMDPANDAPSEWGSGGLRSTELVNWSDKMAADIAGRIDIVDPTNPPVIVVGEMVNRTSTLGPQNLDVFLVRTRGRLTSSGARHGLRFVRERGFVEDARASEYGDRTAGSAPQDYTSLADYMLTGEIFDLPSGQTDFYLMSFQLVQLRDAASGPDVGRGVLIWEGQSEVKYQ
ncbi:MAG: hypothetical protein AB8G96_10980 [Phycisphaerales bacterium]